MLIQVSGVVSFHYDCFLSLTKKSSDVFELTLRRGGGLLYDVSHYCLEDAIQIQQCLSMALEEYMEENDGEEPPNFSVCEDSRRRNPETKAASSSGPFKSVKVSAYLFPGRSSNKVTSEDSLPECLQKECDTTQEKTMETDDEGVKNDQD